MIDVFYYQFHQVTVPEVAGDKIFIDLMYKNPFYNGGLDSTPESNLTLQTGKGGMSMKNRQNYLLFNVL